MTDKSILTYYENLVPFLHNILGPNSEVLLHDVSSPDSSIVAVAGNLSNRKIGGPLTNMALKQIQEKKYLIQDNSGTYKSFTIDGKACRSSSYFIKDDNNKLLGMLCINILVSDLIDIQETLNQLIGLPKEQHEENHDAKLGEDHENLGQSIEELLTSLIDSVLIKYDFSKELSIDNKVSIITELNEKGVFLLKGGVAEVAHRIEMSEPSVYRYLSKIK
ncbi:PAS domain-containing protein [Vagococcus sp. DIV0080]|uniref:PAS domain-containing protein n=1 Tax=Candidatus Vagococcus giribetii TaxID=2230876 RepID=A0ABS3HV86_9ENTE|nr:PAS domain-containing protein [Vagococcus sp. DIV0080]MBO0477653.1 PAS domain-containing protein [Vagococcus sp. DIV0080]